ncbi:MAG: DUF928 domain-containing protein [Nitrospira sp.]
MRYVFIASVGVALTFIGSCLVAAAETPPNSAISPQIEQQLPTYSPPKKLIPRARVGGGLRGTESEEPEIVALVPDHVGLTVKQNPTLNWYLSKTTSHPLQFTLNDTRKIRAIYEGFLPTPAEAGVQSINLKDLGLALEPNVQYRWFVSVRRNQDFYSEDKVAGGMIERCEFSECLTISSAKMTCDQESVRTNALIGLWYDAIDCVCSLIVKEPRDQSLRKMRAALLRQVGLNGVADWDLRSIQSESK